MEVLTTVFAALLLVNVEGAPNNCAKTYRKLLQDLITLKGSCDTAGYRDCCQIKELTPPANSGSYEIENVCNAHESFQTSSSNYNAFCDMNTDGGKWMVIQHRINGSVSFNRNWTDYVHGFGDLEGEFWYGLEKIHCLTTRDDVELRIELGNGTEPSLVWTYQLFRVGDATTNYRLTIGQGLKIKGTRTFDATAYHNGAQFSTPDRDNDSASSNCASILMSGWWFNACVHFNLNGRYSFQNPPNTNPSYWLFWHNGSRNVHYTHTQMKIRPKRCKTSGNTCK